MKTYIIVWQDFDDAATDIMKVKARDPTEAYRKWGKALSDPDDPEGFDEESMEIKLAYIIDPDMKVWRDVGDEGDHVWEEVEGG